MRKRKPSAYPAKRSSRSTSERSGPEKPRFKSGGRKSDNPNPDERRKRPYSPTSGEKPYKRTSGNYSNPGPRGDRKSDEGRFSKGRASRTDSKFSRSRPEESKRFGAGQRERKGSEGKRSGFSKGRPERSNKKFSGSLPEESKRFASGPRERRGSEEKRGFFNKQKFSKRDRKESQPVEEAKPSSDKIRLNKYISNSGVCSRREADNLITMGLISVNGNVITELGYKVNPGDEVRYESKVLRAEKPVYILLNKPKGYLTTTKDPQERNTVMHIIANAVRERVYPVGRLDRNTTGLLLLTNDGDLADKLSHPSYNVKKIYKVELDRALTKADFQKILEGVSLEEGKAMVDDLAMVSDDGKTVGLEIHIGWNRVVRRIFEALNYQVLKLDRTAYAGLDKKDLPRGEWRFLKKEEVLRLKHFK
jgi:23S rRNA pseudouridine2605 synthase